jgi:hypothetical protein
MSDLVEQVARAIHDVLENDDDSKGGGYMRAARAALSVLEPRIEALEREQRWQPIETAPRDGTRVLATDGVIVTVVEWKVYSGRWEKLTGWHHLYGARWNGPVAWRPLPPPLNGERG